MAVEVRAVGFDSGAFGSGSGASRIFPELKSEICPKPYLDSQVAGNNRPLYPKVDHYWLAAAHNYWLSR